MQCGLLGRKLGHSYSPQIHRLLGNYSYELYEKEPNELAFFLSQGEFSGLNVTIPYKKAVIPYCDALSDCARKIGAVNTIVRKPDGTLIGHNTDYFGFSSMVQESGLSLSGKKVLVLGSGGASSTVLAFLEEIGAQAVVISRTGDNNYTNLGLHADASAIVNTTPVGMYPHTDTSPVDIGIFPELEGVLDLIYNPAHTKLLQQAQDRGLVAMNGLWMLVAQAKESAEWFIGNPISDNAIAAIHSELRQKTENLVLIGMPGCGKSTIGQRLAQYTGKKFVDADTEIVNLAGISIPEIFSTHAEAGFREFETKVLAELGKQSGLVIATGGGCVTRSENYPLLRKNGRIIWLQRKLTELPTDGRPLSQVTSLEDMYAIRAPMYKRFSDIIVENNGCADDTVAAIIAAIDTEAVK